MSFLWLCFLPFNTQSHTHMDNVMKWLSWLWDIKENIDQLPCYIFWELTYIIYKHLHIFNLGCVWIDLKLIPEMIFRKMGCLVVTSNSVKLKSISSWPNLRAKTTEMIFRFYFHFKLLPALENRRERERERERINRDITVRQHHRLAR